MTPHEWLATYYPQPAEQVPIDEALEHSLRKWRGLRPQILARHGLRVGDRPCLRDDDGFLVLEMGTSSCALCVHHLNQDQAGDDDDHAAECRTCPLALARGGTPCDDAMPEEEFSPWHRWVSCEDPEPMLRWLEKASKEA